jgi:hypothetical protein
VDDLATVADTDPVQKAVEAFRCRARVAGKESALYLAREEWEHGCGERDAAKRLGCFPTDDDITTSALSHFPIDLKRFGQPHASGREHAE